MLVIKSGGKVTPVFTSVDVFSLLPNGTLKEKKEFGYKITILQPFEYI